MKTIMTIMLIAAMATLSGCATYAYQPVIMGYGNAEAKADALDDCRGYASRISPGRSAGAGALIGALLGAAIGSTVNSDFATELAGIGAAAGAVRGTGDALQARKKIVRRCLKAKGYTVLY